ncbi:MAG TPA: hypothetical protein VMZ22_06335 [Acidimicrobiales bacterium]|nr:hypothetical protein [Acidimicrobiales bacterium]
MEPVSYQDFGAALIDEAVTAQRIERAVGDVAGDHVEVGPMLVGPGDAASVVAKGTIGAPSARSVDAETDGTRRFVVTIPVQLHLSVRVAGTRHNFESSVRVHLRLAVRTAAHPVSIVIDITAPEIFDMEVDVVATGMAGRVLGRLGNVDGKIRKEVAGFIRARLAAPEARAATVINIGDTVEAFWKS